MAPPTSNLDQFVIYSDIKAPADSNKVSHVMIINVAIVLSLTEALYKRYNTGGIIYTELLRTDQWHFLHQI